MFKSAVLKCSNSSMLKPLSDGPEKNGKGNFVLLDGKTFKPKATWPATEQVRHCYEDDDDKDGDDDDDKDDEMMI